jgi:gluconate 2-dehydrogenase gamma chain
MTDLVGRRAFLRVAAAAGAAWATADLISIETALAAAATQTREFKALTAAQAATLDAAASRILPSVDGRPGAHEAGAVFFIDRSLATFNARQKRAYVKGLSDLDRRAARLVRSATFADLPAARQDEILRTIEKSPFFQMLRVDTIFGTFALPVWGGNRNHAGWRMLGLAHQPAYQPPFGDYDRDANKRT